MRCNNEVSCDENELIKVCSNLAGNSAQGICDLVGGLQEMVQDNLNTDRYFTPDNEQFSESYQYLDTGVALCYELGCPNIVNDDRSGVSRGISFVYVMDPTHPNRAKSRSRQNRNDMRSYVGARLFRSVH